MSQKKKILLVVEENVLLGKSNFNASNDLLLIAQALKMGLQVYVTSPHRISKQNQFHQLSVLKLSENLDQREIDAVMKSSWQNQIVNCLLALGSGANNEEILSSKILFLDAKTEIIDLGAVPIFNRAEPISLTNQFYDLLLSWQKNGAKIFPNPYLNKVLGDKLAINAIHNNLAIAGINLLEGVNFKDGENQISFESKIIPISQNNLSAAEISKFYDLLIAQDFKKAAEIFSDEYQIFFRGVQEYLAFHQKLNNDSIIKPASYFGGTGVVVAQNKILDFDGATQNIIQSFLAIKQDCQKDLDENMGKNLAFMPTIIVQERAKLAHLGDLRIMFCGNNLQGIFVRVNPDFEKSKANNLHFGGHPESLFKRYSINKNGVDLMIDDMKKSGLDEKNEELKKAQALYGLLKNIDFLKQIPTLSGYSIIGIDALLTEDKNGNYKYGFNEINLTSPMGQTQLLLLQIAVKFNDLAVKILQENGQKNNIKIHLEKYQILADYFKNQPNEIVLRAKEVLLCDQHLQSSIAEESTRLLTNNFATQTLEHFINQ